MVHRWKAMLAGSCLLAAGVAGMFILLSFREPPAEASSPDEERSLRVTAQAVMPEDTQVTIRGYGEVRVCREVPVASEVPGTVVAVHPNLVVGGIVRAGETLFAVDPLPYETRLEEAGALVGQWEQTVARLTTEFANDRERLKTLERSRDLARAQFDRKKRLLGERIGNETDADGAEQTLNDAIDQVDQLDRQLAVYPIRVEEAQQSMAAAQAKRKMASFNLEKARVAAPFDGRVMSFAVEAGQYVTPGLSVVRLADDAVLEIPVKLEARDARRWLRFNGNQQAPGTAWFREPKHVVCRVRWIEDRDGHTWEGVLDRVEQFDPASRTLTVAVRIPSEKALPHDGDGLPLVAGMFCEVAIPGRTMEGVYALPHWTVSVDNTVFLARENRLKTAAVEVLRAEGDLVYVADGLAPGDRVITTRLVNPLENTLLELRDEGDEGGAANAMADQGAV